MEKYLPFTFYNCLKTAKRKLEADNGVVPLDYYKFLQINFNSEGSEKFVQCLNSN